MRLIVENDNESQVEIAVGESLQISLAENATTGYAWEIDRCEEEYIEAVSREAAYPSSGTVGSGGRVKFTFRAKKAGLSEIALGQRRPWETDRPESARFRIRVRVLSG